MDTPSEYAFSDVVDEKGHYRDQRLQEYFTLLCAEAPNIPTLGSVPQTRNLSKGHLKDLIVINALSTWQSLYSDVSYEGSTEIVLLAQRSLEYLFSDRARTEALSQIAEEYPLSASTIAELTPRRDVAADALVEASLHNMESQASV